MFNDDNYFEDADEYESPDFYSDDYVSSQSSSMPQTYNTPKKIYDFLDTHVYGHDQYKRAVSLLVFKIIHGHKPPGALLVAGASGTGKTELFRVLKKIYPNQVMVDASTVTPSGYKGSNHFTSQLCNLSFTSEFSPIYILDEFDKALYKGKGAWAETGLLSELLKFLEGSDHVNIGTEEKPKWVDTSKICFVLLGSFSSLTDRPKSLPIGFNTSTETCSRRSDLTKEMIISQLTPELQGRIAQIIILNEFTSQDYFNILNHPNYSPISKLEKEFGIHVNVSKEKLSEISNTAYNEQTGVRSMTNMINRYLDEQLFLDPAVKEISIS